jgi:hypothetical protein
MYYLLDIQDATYPCRWIEDVPYLEGINFRRGSKITEEVPQPLKYVLSPLDVHALDHGPEMPAVFKESIPLFHLDVLKAMSEFGIQNIDTYDVEIFDPDNDEIYTNYKAVNIIGLLEAADMKKSNATVHDGVPVIDVDFDGLTIDESKIKGYMLFRLAESTNAILIHEDLKNHLVNKGFNHFCFNKPSESAV